MTYIFFIIAFLILNFYCIIGAYFLGVKHGNIVKNSGIPSLPLPPIPFIKKEKEKDNKKESFYNDSYSELMNYDINYVDNFLRRGDGEDDGER